MATFWATFNYVENRARTGDTMPVMKGSDAEGMTILTTTGASGIVQRSATDWVAPDRGIVSMRCNGAVWVHVDASPEAAPGIDHYLAADERREFSVQTNDKIAVEDA